jgi:ribosomal protein S27AE
MYQKFQSISENSRELPEHPRVVQEFTRRYAHRTVLNALNNGVLERKGCEQCGHSKAIAHHEDYAEPLDVIWLCRKCHGYRHSPHNKLEIRKRSKERLAVLKWDILFAEWRRSNDVKLLKAGD